MNLIQIEPNNVSKNAPHTLEMIYLSELAIPLFKAKKQIFFLLSYIRENNFASVSKSKTNAYGEP